ncbi:MAG: glycosyltransferase family 9 protein [Betaproteobacteria bacterium]
MTPTPIAPTKRISAEQALAAKRVLIINVTRIGDTVLATPAIRAIARFFPNASLTVLGHPKRVEVLAHIQTIQRIGGIDKRSALWRGWRDVITGPEYDWAFVWRNDEELVRYALRKARHVVAHRQQSERINSKLFAAVERIGDNQIHAVAWALSLPAAVGIPADGHQLDYRVSEAEAITARQRLQSDFPNSKGPFIGMQVASFATKSYRDWPIGNFIELATRIAMANADARFVLYGAQSDQDRIAKLTSALPGKSKSYAGAFSLRETVAMMSCTDLYVGVDTGPTHLFGALKKPMVVLYHPSLRSALYKPLDAPALYVVDHPLAGPDATSDIPMMEISVDMVWQAVSAALRGDASTLPGLPAIGA